MVNCAMHHSFQKCTSNNFLNTTLLYKLPMTNTTYSSHNFTICTYRYTLFHNITQLSESRKVNTLRDHNVEPQTTETVKASLARHSHVNTVIMSSNRTHTIQAVFPNGQKVVKIRTYCSDHTQLWHYLGYTDHVTML